MFSIRLSTFTLVSPDWTFQYWVSLNFSHLWYWRTNEDRSKWQWNLLAHQTIPVWESFSETKPDFYFTEIKVSFHSFSFLAASLVISFNTDFWTLHFFISFTLVHETFTTLNFWVNGKHRLKSSDVTTYIILLTNVIKQLLWLLSFLPLFVSKFYVFPRKNTHHYIPSILAGYLLSLYSFFISLSYPDLSRCDTDDGTRTLDPHWWRVNKPSLGVPEALLDYRPKEGWLKGILIKRKSRGKNAWWQTEKLNLYLDSSWWSLFYTLKCLVSPLHHPKFVSFL